MILLAVNFDNLHQILRSLYADMMPLCSQMTGVAKGLAGLGALFYVAYRVWQSLARAEPIDVFPLLRPFALGICIMFFPSLVLGTLNSVMSPVVTGTHSILETQTLDMNEYREQKDRLEFEAMKRNPETAYLVDKEAFDNRLDELGVLDAVEACGMYVDRAMYNMRKSVHNFFRELLELMFNAAALVIDTLRTFFLIVLSILGPISFAVSCWDGFQATLSQWFVRYISIYLWLPVSDLFSSVLARIQVLMLQKDIERLSDPAFIPDGSNAVYITFLIIGIIGYFTIPTVAGWIVQAGGGGRAIRGDAEADDTPGGVRGGGGGGRREGEWGEEGGRGGRQRGARGGGHRRCSRGQCGRKAVQATTNNQKLKGMEFKSLTNIETAFRHLRLFGVAYLGVCTMLVGFSVWKAYSFAEAQRQKIYVLDEGKSLMLALSQDLEQNRPVEAREHVRRFHELFYTLSPDKDAIESNIQRAMFLSDRSAYTHYVDLAEQGYYNRVISGNVNQRIEVDSVRCDFNAYPYGVTTYARLLIIREKSVTERSLVTQGRLLNSTRSDNNPHGFILEAFRVVENRDIRMYDR